MFVGFWLYRLGPNCPLVDRHHQPTSVLFVDHLTSNLLRSCLTAKSNIWHLSQCSSSVVRSVSLDSVTFVIILLMCHLYYTMRDPKLFLFCTYAHIFSSVIRDLATECYLCDPVSWLTISTDPQIVNIKKYFVRQGNHLPADTMLRVVL